MICTCTQHFALIQCEILQHKIFEGTKQIVTSADSIRNAGKRHLCCRLNGTDSTKYAKYYSLSEAYIRRWLHPRLQIHNYHYTARFITEDCFLLACDAVQSDRMYQNSRGICWWWRHQASFKSSYISTRVYDASNLHRHWCENITAHYTTTK
jgi:hypothetical protein